MARKVKENLSYFNIDTDRYLNKKIRKLKKDLSFMGLAVYDYLLCSIYGNSYYVAVNTDLIYDIEDYFSMDKEDIDKVINLCCEIGLFNKELYEKEQILTSKNIQERYLLICKNAKRNTILNKKYILVPNFKLPINSEENQINSEEILIKWGKTAINSEETLLSSEETLLSSEETLLSSEETLLSSEETLLSSEETLLSSEEIPQNKINKNKEGEYREKMEVVKIEPPAHPPPEPTFWIGELRKCHEKLVEWGVFEVSKTTPNQWRLALQGLLCHKDLVLSRGFSTSQGQRVGGFTFEQFSSGVEKMVNSKNGYFITPQVLYEFMSGKNLQQMDFKQNPNRNGVIGQVPTGNSVIKIITADTMDTSHYKRGRIIQSAIKKDQESEFTKQLKQKISSG